MALFPCDIDMRRYAGPQRSMYPALVNGATSYRRRLRLCPSDFTRLLDRAALHCQDAQGDFFVDPSSACAFCGEPVPNADWAFYLTVYDRGEERRDLYGPCHDACVADLAAAFALPAY